MKVPKQNIMGRVWTQAMSTVFHSHPTFLKIKVKTSGLHREKLKTKIKKKILIYLLMITPNNIRSQIVMVPQVNNNSKETIWII